MKKGYWIIFSMLLIFLVSCMVVIQKEEGNNSIEKIEEKNVQQQASKIIKKTNSWKLLIGIVGGILLILSGIYSYCEFYIKHRESA